MLPNDRQLPMTDHYLQRWWSEFSFDASSGLFVLVCYCWIYTNFLNLCKIWHLGKRLFISRGQQMLSVMTLKLWLLQLRLVRLVLTVFVECSWKLIKDLMAKMFLTVDLQKKEMSFWCSRFIGYCLNSVKNLFSNFFKIKIIYYLITL